MDALMRAHPMATLVQQTEAGLHANHIPLLVVREGDALVLRGHVARANPMWQLADQPILAVFQATDAYISPNWYASKAVDHKAVPTWNYAAVHASGVLQVYEDAVWLRRLLSDLTAEHEANLPNPWALADAPSEYVEALLRAVVGIEIRVQYIEAKWKVSQNQPQANRDTLCAALRSEVGGQNEAMAQMIEQFAPKK